MAVLVTGAAGFLGSYVVAALEGSGYRVIGFDVARPSKEGLVIAPSLQHDLRLGHVTDVARLFDICRHEHIEAVVHMAGLVGIEASLERPAATYETNVMGFVNVCEVARQLDVARLVLISSNSVYHGASGDTLMETDPVFSVHAGNPASHYGTSKMMQEAVALAYARSHGMDVSVLRVTAIYGFGMRAHLYMKPMVEGAVLGKLVRIATGGLMKRDYTYVQDCATAVVQSLEVQRDADAPKVLNISAGRVLTASEIADVVRRTTPGADIEIGDALTPLEAASARMRAPFDISAARATIGWFPRWSIEEGVREYSESFRRFSTHSCVQT